MTVGIALLRAINVGGNAKIKMELLRTLCESVGMLKPQTYVQSGNVVFQSRKKNLVTVGLALEAAIEKECGFKPPVILRTLPEWQKVVASNPFPPETDRAKLNVTFFAKETSVEAATRIQALHISPEELHILGREHYVFFPVGVGLSKYPFAKIDRIMGSPGTGRNWNTVLQLLAMAEGLDK